MKGQTNDCIDKIIDKMFQVMQIWYWRNLTLMGKVLIINTLMASLFVYQMTVVPLLTTKQVDKIYKIILSFLWGTKKPKIPLSVLQRVKSMGGLNLVDITAKYQSLLVGWVTKIDASSFLSSYVYKWLCPALDSLVWKCNLRKDDARKLIHVDSFWTGVLTEWAAIHFYEPTTYRDVVEQVVWGNTWIKKGSSVFLPTEMQRVEGPWTIGDLIDRGQWKSFEQISCEYGTMTWLQYRGIISAIPQKWKNKILSVTHDGYIDSDTDSEMEGYINLSNLNMVKQKSNYIYRCIQKSRVNDSLKYFEGYVHRWGKLTGEYLSIEEYISLFRYIYTITNVTKLRDFQYRLLLGKIFTNDTLYKWKILDALECNLCGEEVQSNEHLFIDCKYSKWIWKKIQAITLPCRDGLNWSKSNIFCNTVHPTRRHVCNFLTLVAKQYLFKCKCRSITPNTRVFQEEVLQWYRIEKYNCGFDQAKQLKHVEKWKPLSTFLIVNNISLSSDTV